MAKLFHNSIDWSGLHLQVYISLRLEEIFRSSVQITGKSIMNILQVGDTMRTDYLRGSNIQIKFDYILCSEYIADHFEVLWTSSVMQHHITHSWDTGLSGTLQSDWLQESRTITQEIEFYQTWKFGWKVKCHNSSPFGLAFRKIKDNIKKKIYSGVLFVKIWAKINYLQKLDFLSF